MGVHLVPAPPEPLLSGAANLAALPAAASNRNVIAKTTDGGVYISDGSAWQQISPPTGTYAPATGIAESAVTNLVADLAAKAPQATTERRGVQARGSVCLVLDDIWASHNSVALPAIEAVNGKATLAYVQSYAGTAGKMTNAQVLAAYQRGHEIANHSKTHVDMTGLTAAARQAEWDDPQATLLSLLGTAPKNWIYPFSGRDANTDDEAVARFDRTFWGALGEFVVPNDRDEVPFAVGRFSWTSALQQAALALVQLAHDEPVRVVIYTHDITGGGSITSAEFTALISLASSLNVPLMTLAEAFPAERPLPQSTFSDTTLDDNYDTTSSGAGLTTTSDDHTTTTPPAGLTGSALRSLTIASASSAVASRSLKSKHHLPVRGGRWFGFPCWVKLTKSSGTGGAFLLLDEYDSAGNLLKSNTLAGQTVDTAGSFVHLIPSLLLHPATAFVVPGFQLANAIGSASFINPWTATTAETMQSAPVSTSDLLAVGQETLDRDLMTTGIAAASQSLRFTFFTARKTEFVTQIRMWTGQTAAAATPTIARMGLWSEDPTSGDVTLIAATANDTTLFAATGTPYTRSFTAGVNIQAGRRYAVSDLVVSSAAMPALGGPTLLSGSATELAVAPRRSAAIAAQADLPALGTTVATGTLAGSGARRYAVILP